jgi:hypothetical protein
LHTFDKYDFGDGSLVWDQLYQQPFFSADDYPSWSVVIALAASDVALFIQELI